MTWRASWRQSALRRGLTWYGAAWQARPAAHTGAIILVMLVIWAAGQEWRAERWQQWWAALMLGAWAVWALFQTRPWDSVRADSRVLRWWRSGGRG
ncbi:MAG: hypothetical protein HYY91_00735 [Candidatus Omnitrophica bacterium]|nr:hypothetical protein [Candidatus Omnitrophota bacterium]